MKRYTVENRKIPSTGRDIKLLIFRSTTAKEAIARFEEQYVRATTRYVEAQSGK